MSDTPTVEVKEAKVFNLPSPPPSSQQQIQPNYMPESIAASMAMPRPPSDEMTELQQFEELEKAIVASNEVSDIQLSSPDKTSRDSGVSDGSSPIQEPTNSVLTNINGVTGNGNGLGGNGFGGTGSTASRNPSDPLPKAPVKAEVVTNEIDALEDSRKPPPYHIAAQMSRHANGFQVNLITISDSASLSVFASHFNVSSQ